MWRMKRIVIPAMILVVIFVGLRVASVRDNQENTSQNTTTAKPAVTADFNKQKYSLTNPASQWVVVNKERPLNPKSYVPSDLAFPDIVLRRGRGSGDMQLKKEAARALEEMSAAAKKAGLSIMLASGFRSYQVQTSVYGSEVARFGEAIADTESAKPGYSEHQTGYAADLAPSSGQCVITDCFANTSEGKWSAQNAYKFGFILRYPQNKTAITGYRYEPWHFRFVGSELSKEMARQKVTTLEEFFSL